MKLHLIKRKHLYILSHQKILQCLSGQINIVYWIPKLRQCQDRGEQNTHHT